MRLSSILQPRSWHGSRRARRRRVRLVRRGALAAVATYLALDVATYATSRTGTAPGGIFAGTLTGTAVVNRSLLRLALVSLHQPLALWFGFRSQREAIAAQHRLFGTARGVGADDVADAFRHVFGAAWLSYHLVRCARLSHDDAERFARAAGIAHEDDSRLRGRHYANARAMDLHNNEVGIEIGISQARFGLRLPDAAAALERLARAAIAEGCAVMLDDRARPPRRTTLADLEQALQRQA